MMISTAGLGHRDPSRLGSPRLWSLWDMLRFYASKFVQALDDVSAIRAIAATNKGSFLDQTTADSFKKNLSDLAVQLKEMKLPMTLRSVEKLLKELEATNELTPKIGHLLNEVSGRLGEELETILLFSVPYHADKFEPETPLFGQAVAEKFSSAAYDIEEAGKCLALRRSTACVMHLMRVLEVGLQSLADEVGVPFEDNWNHLIGEIERVIPTYTAKNHGVADEQWFSDVATHFRFIKNAWRNHAMHVHEKYNEEQAEMIFQSVNSFMRQLATRLSDPRSKALSELLS